MRNQANLSAVANAFLVAACLIFVVSCRGKIVLEDGGGASDSGFDSQDVGPADGLENDQNIDSLEEDFGPSADQAEDAQEDYAPQDDIDNSYNPGLCPAQLAARMARNTVSVSPVSINTAAGGYFSRYTPPILAPHERGAWVAWQGTDGKVHVTPLDAFLTRAGQDITLEGNELRGLAAHPGGFAVMFQRGSDQMALVGFDASGNKIFDTVIVGNNNHQTGDKWIKREWGDYGRLVFFQNRYAVYFGHTQNWGSQGEHQGDLLWYYDLSGNRDGGSWDWGCSHSLDVRLSFNGTRLGPVCLSDCYPVKAICFDHRSAVIHEEPSGNCAGSSAAELGGLAPASDGFWLTFVSSEGRSSRDVALAFISNQGVVKLYWLTETPSVQESNAHLAAYGNKLFAAWQAGGEILVALVDKTGMVFLGPEKITAEFNQQTDFVNFPNGDVGWAFGSGTELVVYRVRVCQ